MIDPLIEDEAIEAAGSRQLTRRGVVRPMLPAGELKGRLEVLLMATVGVAEWDDSRGPA